MDLNGEEEILGGYRLLHSEELCTLRQMLLG